jgi:hypothetical protein
VTFARRVDLTDPDRVVRVCVAALVLCGCDVVIGTTHLDPAPALCGPFGTPEPVRFDPALAGANDLSVAADGIHGMVSAMYRGQPGPLPVVFDGAMWTPDTARLAGATLAINLDGGHVGVTGDEMFGWIDHRRTATPAIYEYDYTTTWSQIIPDIAESTQFDLRPGQEVESDAGGGARSRYLVEIFEMFGGGPPHKIEILASAPGAMNTWKPTGFVDPLNRDGAIDIVAGALSGDHKILVYAASDLGTTQTHLFEAAFSHNEFQLGTEMTSLYVSGTTDDQPWLDAACSTIWFRRDGVTQVARRM